MSFRSACGAACAPLLRAALLVACAAALPACEVAEHSEKVQTFRVRGVVHEVSPEHGHAIVEHEDIPGFMPAMTMNFDVPNPAVLGRMAAGQEVSFTLEVRSRSFRITDVRVLGEAPGFAGTSGLLPERHAGEHAGANMDAGAAKPADAPAPGFELTDQDGRTVRLADFEGRTLLLDFIYTHCPGPCPILTATHAEVQAALAPELRERIHFVSISLDPERDTPAALSHYGARHRVDFANWSFLTGARDALEAAWQGYGVSVGPGEDEEIAHLVASFLIDGEGRIRRRYLGLEHSVRALRADLEALAAP